ncbi:MAG: endonuclease/exonuclease/phosphatase family protein [Verrucomicrobiota bacterium]
MKLPLFSLLAILVVFSTHSASAKYSGTPRIETPFTFSNENEKPPSDPESIRICNWNIEWFPAGRRDMQELNVNYQVAAVAGILNELQPDIVLAQEIRNLPVLRLLNRNLNPPGMSHLAISFFYKENTAQEQENARRGGQECAILSRYPWSSIREVDFGTFEGSTRPARGWLYASFEIGEHTIHVYNGHLKSNFGADNPKDRARNIAKRLAAIEELKDDLDRLNLDPYRDKIILAGDFNSDFFSKDFADEKMFDELDELGFSQTFTFTTAEERITIPAKVGEPWPSSTFDYIYLSSGWKIDEATAKVLQKGAAKRKDVYGGDEAGLASDHYPVYIDLPLN